MTSPKTILITGATDGIGLLTAQKLAVAGHRVLLHGRNPGRLTAARQSIAARTAGYLADLSQPSAVATLARAILNDYNQLDVIIHNAGVLKAARNRAETGRDIRFEVNTIAPYHLTMLLRPALAPDARVITLSSAAQAPVDVAALRAARPMPDMDAYAQSKLALTIWTAALAQGWPRGPAFVSINPGSLLATKMVREGFGIAGNDVAQGANVLIRAALEEAFFAPLAADPQLAATRYFDNDIAPAGAFALPRPDALDPAKRHAVMQALAEITGLAPTEA